MVDRQNFYKFVQFSLKVGVSPRVFIGFQWLRCQHLSLWINIQNLNILEQFVKGKCFLGSPIIAYTKQT